MRQALRRYPSEGRLHGGEGLLRLSGTGNADIAGMWAKYEDTVKLNMQKVNNWISGNEG